MGISRGNDGSTVPPFGLVPCPECRKFVSSEAEACPHCGRPMRASPASILLKVVLVCVALGLVGLVAAAVHLFWR
jgi:hypothetical protein